MTRSWVPRVTAPLRGLVVVVAVASCASTATPAPARPGGVPVPGAAIAGTAGGRPAGLPPATERAGAADGAAGGPGTAAHADVTGPPAPSDEPTGRAVTGSTADACAAAAAARTPGWLARENARSGPALHVPVAADVRRLAGYADRPSGRCGDVVELHLSAERPRRVRISAYRIGDYRGNGSRRAWRSAPLTVRTARALRPADPAAPGLVEPAWPVTTRLALDDGWLPGFYLLQAEDLHGRPVGAPVPLTVRDDASRAPVLFKASTLTWAAYGTWGGYSLYRGPGADEPTARAARAGVVSLRRPLAGGGWAQLYWMDLPVVRQLEALGPDVAYTTDEDVDAAPATLLRHAELVSGGHSEYWTPTMYDGLLDALDRGVNAAFLGANNLWWRSRLEWSPDAPRGALPDRLAVHRTAAADPLAAHDPLQATTLWVSRPHRRDPAAVLGQSHAAIAVRGGLQLQDAPAWFTAGTGLARGNALRLAVGNEADGHLPAAHNPAAHQTFAAGLLQGADGPHVVSVDYSTRPSGAAVFAAGTTDWACVPSGRCADLTPPGDTATAVRRLTANVVLALAEPGAGTLRPALGSAPVTAASLVAAARAGTLHRDAVGHYGLDEED